MRTKAMIIACIISFLYLLAGFMTVDGPHEESEPSLVFRTENVLKEISDALIMYRLKYKRYPSEHEGLNLLVETNELANLPTDSWGNKIIYRVSGNSVKLISLGNDSKLGGSGYASDITKSLVNK